MYAILTAGGIPLPGEPLFEYTQGQPKALLEIAGKPMIQWVLDALSGSQNVEAVVIMGLSPESRLTCVKPLYFLRNQGEMLDNIFTGVEKVLEIDPKATHTIVVSSDIPALTPEIVDWLVNNALKTDHDLYYTVIPRSVMESRFPGSKRTYTRLRDVEVCGGDINVIRTLTVTDRDAFWRKIIASRKNPVKQALMVGFDLLFGLLTHSLTLAQAEVKISKRVGLRGKVVLSPYAEAGMDVDKPRQYELLRADLESRVKA